jgi:hypothetical protein
MAAALTRLKGFIQTYSGYNFGNITASEIEELKTFVAEAAHTARWEIEAEYQRLQGEAAKKQYVTNLQSQLSYLASAVHEFKNDPPEPDLKPDFLNWVTAEIFKLLEHVKVYFSVHFDFLAEMPPGFVEYHRERQRSPLRNLIDKISGLNIDQELRALIRNYSEATGDSGKFVIKIWRQLDYQLMAIQVITNFMDDPPSGDLDLELLKLFVAIDFNSIQVYAFFIKYIERVTLGETSFQEQQQEILYLLKVFRQVRVDAPFPFDSRIQSLNVSVVESLEAELNYIEQKDKLYLQNFRNTNPNSPSKFYFTVAVTLAELMFLFRVMLEVKLIFTKFNSYLYEFIANHIRTERAENISKKSMRNHFNNKPFPDRVVQNVKSWLEKMIQHIHLYYDI